MVLFNKKKKDTLSDLPKPSFNISRLPDLPRKESFEEYKPIIPDFSRIKLEVNKPKFEMPQQEPEFEEPEFEEQKIQEPVKKEDTDLFVKVGKYEQAMKSLEEVKDSFKKTEDILKNLQTIKQNEDKEISNWYAQIQKLKNKIISVDSVLFESKK
ncbi:MAG: hypothetical protein ISS82_03565 [Nanoarchaeota archaeon]|nr:hypothetical protein [Nanoarchaeota archaeon]